jgi:hypothetical protein
VEGPLVRREGRSMAARRAARTGSWCIVVVRTSAGRDRSGREREETGRACGCPEWDTRAQPVSPLAPPGACAIQIHCAPGIIASEDRTIRDVRANSEWIARPRRGRPRSATIAWDDRDPPQRIRIFPSVAT